MNTIDEKKLAPVIVFGYNRPNHLQDTLFALNNCDLADETNLYIFCDGPKGEPTPEILKVRETVEQFCGISKFKNTKYYFSKINKGLAKSIINGVTDIINEYGKVIVLEDDLVCSSNFLIFMNQALGYYGSCKNIWSISGYTFSNKELVNLNDDVFFMGRASSWGWATWKDRWDTIDWEVTDYKKFQFNLIKRLKFARWGRDLPIMLDQQVHSNINSWAIRWVYEQSKQNKLSVYPKKSLIENRGADGSGEHKANTNSFLTIKDDGLKKSFEFVEPHIVEKIRKECKKKYGFSTSVYIRVFTKNLLIRLGVIK